MPVIFLTVVFSLLVATIQNNLGVFLKDEGDFEQAKNYYLKSFTIRSKILGESHQETIVVLHNMAECMISAGEDKEATLLQEKIIKLIEEKNKFTHPSNSRDPQATRDYKEPPVDPPKASLNNSTEDYKILPQGVRPPRKSDSNSKYKPFSRKTSKSFDPNAP